MQTVKNKLQDSGDIKAAFTEFDENTEMEMGVVGDLVFQAKLNDYASRYDGIAGGRVTKLDVWDERRGIDYINYDMKWIKRPDAEHEEHFLAVMMLLENAPKRFADGPTIGEIIPGNIELEDGGIMKYVSLAPEGTVFVKINSHRASSYVRRTGIPNISFWNLYVSGSAAQSVHLIYESDYNKIKDITGVSAPIKQLKSPGQVWSPRLPLEGESKQKYDPNTDLAENKKLYDAYYKLNEENFADGGVTGKYVVKKIQDRKHQVVNTETGHPITQNLSGTTYDYFSSKQEAERVRDRYNRLSNPVFAYYKGEDDWGNELYKGDDGITYAKVDGAMHTITDEGEPNYITSKTIVPVKLEHGGKTDKQALEGFIARYNLWGKDAKVKFKDDPKTYFTKNIHPDRKHIFVFEEGESGSRCTRDKSISDIVSVEGKPASVSQFMEAGGLVGMGASILAKYHDKLIETIVYIKEELADTTPSPKEDLLKTLLLESQDKLHFLIQSVPDLLHNAQALRIIHENGGTTTVDIEDINALKKETKQLSDAEVIQLYPVFFEGKEITESKITSDIRNQLAKHIFESTKELNMAEDIADVKFANGGKPHSVKKYLLGGDIGSTEWTGELIKQADAFFDLLQVEPTGEDYVRFIQDTLKHQCVSNFATAENYYKNWLLNQESKMKNGGKYKLGGTITPQKKVKANQAIAISEVLAYKLPDGTRPFRDLGPMEAGMLYNLRDKEGTKEVSDATGLKEQIYKKLEDKIYIDIDYNDWTFTLSDSARDFINRVNNRLETRKSVKAGLDLFPETANIPELKMKNGGNTNSPDFANEKLKREYKNLPKSKLKIKTYSWSLGGQKTYVMDINGNEYTYSIYDNLKYDLNILKQLDIQKAGKLIHRLEIINEKPIDKIIPGNIQLENGGKSYKFTGKKGSEAISKGDNSIYGLKKGQKFVVEKQYFDNGEHWIRTTTGEKFPSVFFWEFENGGDIKKGDNVYFKNKSYSGSHKVIGSGKESSGFKEGFLLKGKGYEVGARKSEVYKKQDGGSLKVESDITNQFGQIPHGAHLRLNRYDEPFTFFYPEGDSNSSDYGRRLQKQYPKLIVSPQRMEDGGTTVSDDELMEMLSKYYKAESNRQTFKKYGSEKSLEILLEQLSRLGILGSMRPDFAKYIKENHMDIVNNYIKLLRTYENDKHINMADDIENFFKSVKQDGGTLNLEDVTHLPYEISVYVPSTKDVDKQVTKPEMDKRTSEVTKYLADKFGGYTSMNTTGGYFDHKHKLVKEPVIKITSFSTEKDFKNNKQNLLDQIRDWSKEWGQEAVGLEFEGDLYYVSENKMADGGRTTSYIKAPMLEHYFITGPTPSFYQGRIWQNNLNMKTVERILGSDRFEEFKRTYYLDLTKSEARKFIDLKMKSNTTLN